MHEKARCQFQPRKRGDKYKIKGSFSKEKDFFIHENIPFDILEFINLTSILTLLKINQKYLKNEKNINQF